MQFDSDMALTLDLIRLSISVEIPSSEYMRSIFDDIAFGFFENEAQNLNN